MAAQSAAPIDTLLLLGLPACGKSVIRGHLTAWTTSRAGAEAGNGLGSLVQLDDYPYIAFLWRIDEIVTSMGHARVFLNEAWELLRDMRVWGANIHLINDDYAALDEVGPLPEPSAAEWLLGRLESAFRATGMSWPLSTLPTEVRLAVAADLEERAGRFAADRRARVRPPGSTVIMEFARGGPEGASPPLEAPYGYTYSLPLLSARILERAVILHVWVTPHQSRERNRKRALPNAQGSILHHAVPETTLRMCYGVDDMDWLLEHGERPGTVTVRAHGRAWHVPAARFDNSREVEALHVDEPAGRTALDELTADRLHAALTSLARPQHVDG